MYVRAKVGAGPAVEQARSVLVKVAPRYKLECLPNPVVRGQNVSCEVTVQSSSLTTTAQGWVFTSAGDPSFEQSEPGHSGLIWSGKAVASGEVLVSVVTTRLSMVDLTAPLNVSPRPSWQSSASARDSIVEVVSSLPVLPTKVQDLGRIEYTWSAPLPSEIDSADSGPNREAKFLIVLPRIRFEIMINRAALDPASAFVMGHPTSRGVNCSRADVVAQLGPIMAHEGMNKEALSHSRRYFDFMSTYAEFRTVAETIVASPGAPLDDALLDANVSLGAVRTMAKVVADSADLQGHNNWSLPGNCKLIF